MPLVVITTEMMFMKIFSFYDLTNFILKRIWCGSDSEGIVMMIFICGIFK